MTKTLASFHLELNVLLLPQGLRPLTPAVHPSLLLFFKAQMFLSQVSQIPSLLSSTPKHTSSSVSNLTLSHSPQSSLRKVPPRATSQGVKPTLLAHRGISKRRQEQAGGTLQNVLRWGRWWHTAQKTSGYGSKTSPIPKARRQSDLTRPEDILLTSTSVSNISDILFHLHTIIISTIRAF